jgi:hypothetical protein
MGNVLYMVVRQVLMEWVQCPSIASVELIHHMTRRVGTIHRVLSLFLIQVCCQSLVLREGHWDS